MTRRPGKAPEGVVAWVCGGCGRWGLVRDRLGDTSCVIWAVLARWSRGKWHALAEIGCRNPECGLLLVAHEVNTAGECRHCHTPVLAPGEGPIKDPPS